MQALEQAATGYQSQGNKLQQASVLANLSLAYQQLGNWARASQALAKSLSLLEQSGKGDANRERLDVLAQVLDVQGRLELSRGNAEKALATWQRVESLYRQAGNNGAMNGGITKARLNQAQALRSLGFSRRCLDLLTDLNKSLKSQPDSREKAVALRALGDALQLVGDLPQSAKVLQQSLEIAQRLQLSADSGAALLSLGNTARAQKDYKTAIASYELAANITTVPLTRVQAHLNQLSLAIDQQQWENVQLVLPQLLPELEQLPSTRAGVYARINFAQALLRLGNANLGAKTPALSSKSRSQLLQDTLVTAIQQSRDLGDKRAESYALGTLGAVYEQAGQWIDAKTVTQTALVLAQSSNTWDIAYRWQWQLGRLLRREWEASGKTSQSTLASAIAAHETAIANLKSLRGDLAAANPDIQFNFRDSVEPIYRQSVELLLQSLEGETDEKKVEATLNNARERMEALQLAELDNFFREACLEGKRVLLDQVVDKENPTTAIIYPIVLRDRQQQTVSIQTIAKIPNQPLKRYVTNLSEAEFDKTVNDLQESVAKASNPSVLPILKSRSKTIYSWLIDPVDQDIQAIARGPKTKANESGTLQTNTAKAAKVDTLVFVLDDVLRNVPMAVLWDGQQYLVEKYGIALSLGLQLFDPKPIQREPLKVLAAGLSTPPKGAPREFSELQYVQPEIDSIARLGIPTTELINQEFTTKALEKSINAAAFNVVHLATHGQFSSRSEDTFILAADGPINVNQFDTLLRSRDIARPEAIQLLVLSACQTAANDNRATLGLAGFAVRAGARSTLASLRNASDESTSLMIAEFYKALNNPKQSTTKAEALRQAQVALLKNPEYRNFNAPQYWAPYVLIGNWL